MAFRGDLASFSLAEIFQSLSLNQADGTLMVSDGENRSHLYFAKGQIVPLTAVPLDLPGLDLHLLKQEVIDGDMLASLRAELNSGTSLVEALVRKGVAREDDLLPLVKQRMEEAIYDLFLWEDAFFEFRKDEIPPEFKDRLDAYRKITFQPSPILMEAMRRVDEWVRITSRIPSLKYIFVPREENQPPPSAIDDTPLKPAEIWPHVAGENNVGRIQELTGATKFDVSQTLYALLHGRHIRPMPPERLEIAFQDALKLHEFSRCLMLLEYAMVLGLAARSEQEKMAVALLSDRVFIPSPEVYHLSGRLEDFNFASLFLALFLKKHSGTIRVEDSESKKIIHFSPLEISILSTGAREQLKFGEILVREGKISYRELDRALTLARERGDLLGQVLIQEEMITEEDRVFATRKKIIDEIFDIFLWRNARFELIKNETPREFSDNRLVARLELGSGDHLKELLASFTRFGEISRQISSRAIFKRQKRERRESKAVGVLGTWLGQMGEAEEQGETDPLLELVDGRRTVSDLIRVTQGRGIDICERLFHLLNRGVIRPLSAAELRQGADKALEGTRPDEGLKFCEFALERGYDRAFFTKAIDDLKARNPGLIEGTREYKIEGDFGTFSLADLFQSLYLNKHSGTLSVSDGVNEKMIYISKGTICLSSRGAREVSRLGDILVDAGKVSERDVSRALEVQKGSGKKIGEILVEEGLVAQEEIHEAIREKIKEELFDIFLWDSAYFTFTKNYFPDEFTDPKARTTRLELDTTRILMTAINRIEEWGRMEETFRTLKAVLYVPEGAKIPMDSLSRKDKEILSLVDGRNNLDEIIARSGAGRFKTCQILYGFSQKGWATPMDLDRLNHEAEEAFSRHEFELCVKYYEYAMHLDQDNVEIRQTLDLIRGKYSKNLDQKKIRIKGVDLSSLFSTLIREMRSGTLTAKDAKSRRFIYFAPDEILILSEGVRKSPDVEDLLIEQGKLTEKVLARARDRQKQLGMDLAYILEKQGIVPYNEIDKLRKKKAFEDVEDLFHWPDVSIEFEPNHLPSVLENPVNDTLALRMNVWEMLQTIVERISEWNRIRKIVPSEDVVFVAAPPSKREGRVFHPMGERILNLADGRRAIRTVFAELGGDWFEAYRALKKLHDAKLIRPLSAEEATREAQNALVFNEKGIAEALYRSVLAVQPGNAEVRGRLEALKTRKTTTRRHKPRENASQDVRLADVLQNVASQNRSGTLSAEREDGSCTLFVSADKILLLTSGAKNGPYLGEMLVECGFAKLAQIEKALKYQQKTRKRLGEILVLQGVVNEDRLKYALREKVLAEIHILFGKDRTRFRFDEGGAADALTAPDVPVTEIPLDGHALLKEALKREREWPEIGKVIPSEKTIFLRLDTEVRRKGNTAQKNPLLHLVNGKRDLQEILRNMPGSHFMVMRDLARLVKSQVIRPLTAEEARKIGNEAYMFNEFRTAIVLYEWALELNPNDRKVLSNLERARSFLGGAS